MVHQPQVFSPTGRGRIGGKWQIGIRSQYCRDISRNLVGGFRVSIRSRVRILLAGISRCQAANDALFDACTARCPLVALSGQREHGNTEVTHLDFPLFAASAAIAGFLVANPCHLDPMWHFD